MSGSLGKGRKGNANTVTKYTQYDVQTSAQGLPIPIGWGKFRVAPNLIDIGGFQAIPQFSGAGGKGAGGKGGGGGKGGREMLTGYDYRSAVIMALCEGPIQGLGIAWRGRDSELYSAAVAGGFVPNTLFLGDRDQPVWGWLTTAAPDHALSYSSTAYLADSALDLGSTPALPNYGFEVIGRFSGSIPGEDGGNLSGPGGDANPADIINDFLTNSQYGIGFGPPVATPGSFIDEDSWSFYHSYCQAEGLLLSPVLESQEEVRAIIDRWAMLTNSWIFWSGGALKFAPLGDVALLRFGASYAPKTTPVYDLTYDDFVVTKDRPEPPVTLRRIDPAAAPNTFSIEILFRGNNTYAAHPIRWQDDGLINQYGRIHGPSVEAHDIKELFVGATIAQLIGQRGTYLRNGTVTFKLGWEFLLLEPGDLVTLTDPHLGMDRFPVRIRQMDEDGNGVWAVTAEEFPGAVGNASAPQPQQSSGGNTVNMLVAPGDVNPPAIFEPLAGSTGGIPQLWIAASGGAFWGGCNVWLSFDGVNFSVIGAINNPARQGVLLSELPLVADPDTTDTVAVDLSESFGAIDLNANQADANAGRTLCLLTAPFVTEAPCDGEFFAYGFAAARSQPYQYDLSYLRRGLYGTMPADWSIGSFFTRIDLASAMSATAGALLTYDLPAAYIGVKLFLKFQSFNRFGMALQDIADVTEYTYTPCGHGFGPMPGGCPDTPTGLSAAGRIEAVLLSWHANAAADNVIDYKIYRAAGHGATFNNATLLATTPGLNWTDTGLPPLSEWTYFVTAQNAMCESLATAGVDGTALSPMRPWYQQFSVGGAFGDLAIDSWDGNYEIFDVVMPIDVGFPPDLSTSPTPGCEVAPGGDAILTFQTIHAGLFGLVVTTVATLTYPAGQITGSYASADGFIVPAGDRLRLYAPSTIDAAIVGAYGTLVANGGGPPAATLSIDPPNPVIYDTTPLGTVVATITVEMSGGFTYAGGAPVFGGPYFDDGARFEITGPASGPGPYSLVLSLSGPGVPPSHSIDFVTIVLP